MHTLPAPPFKGMGKLIHIAAWAILFGLPFFFTGRESQTVTVLSYVRSMIVPLSFMLVFYANYFVLIDHFLFAKRPWKFLLCNVVLIAASMGAVHLMFELLPHPEWEHPRPEREWQETVGFFMVNAMLYMLVAGLSVAIKMTGSWYEMESSRRELEKSRAEAELQNLKSQLNPHFLFNTLNNIYALIAFDTDKAQTAVQELSRLLRHVLYDNQQNFVTLGKEMDFIKNYIALMRIRLSSNVTVETRFDIRPDSPTEIAPLIFISLIENAFKHGISPTEPSFIRIHFSESPGEIHCEITNSYHPKSVADKSGSGIGLEQVRKRLELTYPGRYEWKHGISEDGKEYKSVLTINY